MSSLAGFSFLSSESKENLIEGIGNEVVVALLTTIVIVTTIVVIGSRFCGYRLRHYWQIHPSSVDAVTTARRYISNRFAATVNGDSNQENTNQPHYGMDTQCPVCLNEPRLPIETNCGHLFCANCLIVYWRHGRWLGPVHCPVCRTQVSLMLTCFRLEPPPGADDNEINERIQVLNEINQYNRRFSGEPRPWIDYIRDLPTLLRHLTSEFFTLGGLMYMLRVRILLCFLAAIMYLISPLDLIPEAVFGVLGLLDDLFVVLLLAIYVSMIYRRFLADRWTTDD